MNSSVFFEKIQRAFPTAEFGEPQSWRAGWYSKCRWPRVTVFFDPENGDEYWRATMRFGENQVEGSGETVSEMRESLTASISQSLETLTQLRNICEDK